MILITVTMKVPEQHQATLIRHAVVLAAASRKEAGNISYDCVRSVEDPEMLLMLERWSDMASLEAHRREPHVAAYIEAVNGLIAERHIELRMTEQDAPA